MHDIGRNQRRHAQGVARVVREHQEGGVVGQEAAVQGQAVADGAHAELAHAEIHVVRVGVVRGDRLAAFPQRQVRMRQVGRAADQFRQQRTEGFQRHLRGLARGDDRALGLQFLQIVLRGFGEALGQLAAQPARQLGRLRRILRRVGLEQRVPFRFARTGAVPAPGFVDRGGDLERRMRPAQLGARGGDLVLAQRRAMRRFLALLGRRAETDHGTAADQRGLVRFGQRGLDGLLDFHGIVTVDLADHLPAVGFETRGGVVGEPAVGIAVDRDVVVVPEADQLAQSPGTGERSGFVRDAFHQAAVAEENPGAMVDDIETVAIETLREQFFRQGETDRVRQALAERAGRRLDARRFVPLRMTGGLRMQLPETLDLVHRQVVAGQVQQRVLQHRAMPVRQHETVAVGPLRIVRVVPEEIVPEHFGNVGHAHRHAGMTGFGLLDGVGGEETDGVREVATGRLAHGAARGRRRAARSGRAAYCPKLVRRCRRCDAPRRLLGHNGAAAGIRSYRRPPAARHRFRRG